MTSGYGTAEHLGAPLFDVQQLFKMNWHYVGRAGDKGH
jgi:hypothetical protein